jgi:hypothetical protein
MQSWTQTLTEAEDSLRKLDESIRRVQIGWPFTAADTNGTAGGGLPPDSLRQLSSELSVITGRCGDLPNEAFSAVESAWQNLEANALSDWDAVGRQVLDLLAKQAEAVVGAAKLVRRGEQVGLSHAPDKLAGEESSLRERTREFLDSWPWSTGNKPGDEEDAAAARRALQALPSFDVLWRLAREYPPPEGWPDEE